MGDCPVTTIASCGARRSAVLSRALGVVEGEPVDVVVQGTIALLDTTCIVDSAIAITASSVVALELRQADLIHDGPHGVSQLTPVLQRWLRLHTGDALLAKKKLLLLVTDADVAEVPATKLTELAAASLARVLAGLDAESVLDAHKLFEVHLIAVPAGATEMTLNEIKDQIFKLSDSEWTLPASAALMAVARAAAAGLGCSDAAFALSMAEANEAYTCMRAADDAARCFTQGLVTLKKSAEVFVADFGAQATSLLDEALDAFDGETEGNGLAPAARAGLRNQLLRALTPLFRRQLLVLQRQTLQVFEHSLRAAPPSVTIEAELKALIEEADAAFEKQAAALLVPGCSWSYGFEKKAVTAACWQAARGRVEELRIQGLYLPQKGAAIPLDIAAHIFFPAPFGKDGGQDSIKASEGRVRVNPTMVPLRVSGEGTGVPNLSEPNEMNRNGMIFKNGKLAGAT